jgi:hypothetical protein
LPPSVNGKRRTRPDISAALNAALAEQRERELADARAREEADEIDAGTWLAVQDAEVVYSTPPPHTAIYRPDDVPLLPVVPVLTADDLTAAAASLLVHKQLARDVLATIREYHAFEITEFLENSPLARAMILAAWTHYNRSSRPPSAAPFAELLKWELGRDPELADAVYEQIGSDELVGLVAQAIEGADQLTGTPSHFSVFLLHST